MRRILALMALAASIFAGIGVQPAGAFALIHESSQWFLARDRACLISNRFHDDGAIQTQMWCHNNAYPTSSLVGVMSTWQHDFMANIVQPGQGNGVNAARVHQCWDGVVGYPWSNFTGAPFYIDDIYQSGPYQTGGSFWLDGPGSQGRWEGTAWWSDIYLSYFDVANSYDGCATWYVY